HGRRSEQLPATSTTPRETRRGTQTHDAFKQRHATGLLTPGEGVRIEELLELTHLSLRPFRKPDGQIIPLLQIAPSKCDVERVLPVGPELAHVLSRIVLRISETSPDTGSGATNPPTVPLVSRWDWHERVHTPPMPFLF